MPAVFSKARARVTIAERADRPHIAIEAAVLTLIWLNILALILESVPALGSAYGSAFRAFEVASVAIFTVEYVARTVRNGRRFTFSGLGIIDLLAILPFYLTMITVDLRVLRIARSFRVYRLFQVAKLGRYSAALQTLGRVVVAKRAELAAAGGILMMLLLIASTVMYYAENGAQPDSFSSIPATMWWAISTITTVGYGDVYPITATGRAFASVVAVLGIGMFALPTGILGAAFVAEQQRTSARQRCPHCGGAVD